MNRVNRRTVLKGAAVAGAAASAPLGTQLLGAGPLTIFDSRLPESLAFARSAAARRRVDLAEQHANRFAQLRGALPKGLRIEGLTRWSDLVALRRELGRQGYRLQSETQTARGLYRWTMA
jgi:hypothetical protein